VASTNAIDKAEAAFRKEEQQREGAKAMKEYLAAQVAEQKKTERLRALRLARDEDDQRKTGEDIEIPAAPAVKKSRKSKKKLS
jgi:hypothetical protein